MKTFRRMYIYKETHLPSVGWLHGCFVCYTITGICEVFSKKETRKRMIEHVVYICPNCKKLIQENNKVRQEYKTKVNEYIHLHAC